MKVKIDIRIAERESYGGSKELAVGALEVEHIGEFNAAAIRRTMEDAIEDASQRVADQLRAIQKQKDASEREAAEAMDVAF